jgi:hypothetical protein
LPIYTLGGSRPPAFQFPATDIPSSSTPSMFQPSTFDTAAEDQLAWDEFGYNDILATMDGAPQQADEVGTSQLTQPPPVLTRPSQLAAGGATLAGGGATPTGAERHRPAERHRMLQARRRWPWRHRLPTSYDCGSSVHLTPGRTTGTTPGLALELLGGRETSAFRCSTMILYKLFPCDYV